MVRQKKNSGSRDCQLGTLITRTKDLSLKNIVHLYLTLWQNRIFIFKTMILNGNRWHCAYKTSWFGSLTELLSALSLLMIPPAKCYTSYIHLFLCLIILNLSVEVFPGTFLKFNFPVISLICYTFI